MALVGGAGKTIHADEPYTGVAEAGRSVYTRYCATCHGSGGDGRGPTARYFQDVPPRDFTTGLFKFRSTPFGLAPTSQDLIRTIRRGVPGTAMPQFGGILDVQQVADVAAYVQTFTPEAADAPPEPIELPATLPEVTADSVADGRAVFLMHGCWTCHGAEADGNGPTSDSLVDSQGLAIRAASLHDGVLKNGSTRQDILRTLSTGFNGTPMVAFFQAPILTALPLVMTQGPTIDGLRASADLSAEDLSNLERFVATLPDAAEFAGLGEAGQAERVQAWRIALVDYIYETTNDASGRRFWGLTPQPILYGPDEVD